MKIQTLNNLMILIMIGYFPSLYSCITTFTNDSSGEVIVEDANSNTIVYIKKNKSRRFGSPHQKTHLKIYAKQFNNKVFDLMFTVEQMQCAAHGNPHIKYSDLEHDRWDTQLFSVTRNTRLHTPMVRKLLEKTRDEKESCPCNNQ